MTRIDSSARPLSGHLESPPSGGSLTNNLPPALRNPVAHSATTAGGPNDLETTKSNPCLISTSRAHSSARPRTTRTRSAIPRRLTARSKKSVLLSAASSSVHRLRGSSIATTSPGSPAPLPRSRQRTAASSPMRSVNLDACAMWLSTGPDPTKPSSRASERRSVRTERSSPDNLASTTRSCTTLSCTTTSIWRRSVGGKDHDTTP